MKLGQAVRQNVRPIAGRVIDIIYSKDKEQLEHLVEWVDEAGETHSRWFLESELELVTEGN